MSYTRREVKDHVTVMNKDLYDNLQDGIDEAKEEIIQVDTKSETAMSIAKGKNRAHVFSTTKAMMSWLSDVNNKGLYNIGDNLYIVDIDVPDWWISEVLTEQDIETGFYYKIAQLEGQKVDLTEIMAELNSLGEKTEEIEESLLELGGFTPIIDPDTGKITGYTTIVGGADTVFPFSGGNSGAPIFPFKIVLSSSGSNGSGTSTFIGCITKDGGVAQVAEPIMASISGEDISSPTSINGSYVSSSYTKTCGSAGTYSGSSSGYAESYSYGNRIGMDIVIGLSAASSVYYNSEYNGNGVTDYVYILFKTDGTIIVSETLPSGFTLKSTIYKQSTGGRGSGTATAYLYVPT